MPGRVVRLGNVERSILDVVTGFLEALKQAIATRSNLRSKLRGKSEALQVAIATPANAHAAQRFVTIDAFRRAGFEVMAMLNEPSAAGFEYTHRHRDTLSARRDHVVVYDLGGGTFDASLVRMSGSRHDVLATAGINLLGGDDLDAAMAELAMAAVGTTMGALSTGARARLLEACREEKERLNPSSRKITLDLEHALTDEAPRPSVSLAVADYYDACKPLIERTIEAMLPVMARMDGEAEGAEPAGMADIAGIYVVGGASELPVVPRALRERFGRRVHRSPYASSAIAIGLAIAGDEHAGFALADRFSRTFGVFRESAGGDEITFDAIFTRETELPARAEAPVLSRRSYRAAHNVGHFRFFECSTLDQYGAPKGDLALFGDVHFPFDRTIDRDHARLDEVPVTRAAFGPSVEEEYALDENGIVEVTIRNVDDGYTRTYRVGA